MRKSTFYHRDGSLKSEILETPPISIRFNKCDEFDHWAYELLLHEIAHGLGLSGFEYADLIKGIVGRDNVYHAAHPAVPDAVMNYDNKVPENDDRQEPDCTSHPMGVMAVFALYQTVP